MQYINQNVQYNIYPPRHTKKIEYDDENLAETKYYQDSYLMISDLLTQNLKFHKNKIKINLSIPVEKAIGTVHT